MPKPIKVQPEQARFIAALVKRRFPFINTNRSVDLSDVIADLQDFWEILTAIGEKPDNAPVQKKLTTQERRESATIIAALQFFADGVGGFEHPEWNPVFEKLRGGPLCKDEIAALVARIRGGM